MQLAKWLNQVLCSLADSRGHRLPSTKLDQRASFQLVPVLAENPKRMGSLPVPYRLKGMGR